jgi:hypothetical protein
MTEDGVSRALPSGPPCSRSCTASTTSRRSRMPWIKSSRRCAFVHSCVHSSVPNHVCCVLCVLVHFRRLPRVDPAAIESQDVLMSNTCVYVRVCMRMCTAQNHYESPRLCASLSLSSLSVSLSLCLSVSLSLCLSVSLSLSLSVCLSVCLSLCVSICLSCVFV